MTREEKDLVFRDLCTRFPYGIIGAVPHYDENGEEALLQGKITGFNKGQIKFEYLPDCTDDIGAYNWFDIDLVKPYLRSLSSITEKEQFELSLVPIYANMLDNASAQIDWLNAHYFDYRGLIEKGLAISTEEFNPYK